MTVLELKEFEILENLQALFRDPEAQERLSHLGVRTALVATWDGLVVDSVVNDDQPVALETLAANAAAALQLSHDKPARGHVDGVLAEFDAGSTLIVDPVGDNSLVAFVINPSSDVEHLRAELRTLVKLHTTGGSAPSTPSLPAAPVRAQRPLPPQADPIPTPRSGSEPAASPVQEIIRSTPAGRRVILKGVSLDAAGFSATVTVELLFNGQRIVGKAVTRNDSTRYVSVAAEATIQAVTQLLPDGYGVVLDLIAPLASEAEQGVQAVSVRVLFLSPDGEQTLLGIAKLTGDDPAAGAKTVLSAVNSHLEAVLALQNDYIN